MTHVQEAFAVSIPEAGRLLGFSPSRIDRLAASDPTFPRLRKVGRASRFDPRELHEWYDVQTVSSRESVSGDFRKPFIPGARR